MTPATIRDICSQWGTRERLMTAAETLLGEHGFDGISLEEIARAAEQKNKYAVQYHFGDRGGLAKAILDVRTIEVDRRRSQMLAEGVGEDLASLLTAFLAPIADQVDPEGKRSYALFLQQLAIQGRPWPDIVHPLEARHDSGTLKLFGMMCAALPNVGQERAGQRLRRLMHLPLLYFGEAGAAQPPGNIIASPAFDEIVAMMAAALSV